MKRAQLIFSTGRAKAASCNDRVNGVGRILLKLVEMRMKVFGQKQGVRGLFLPGDLTMIRQFDVVIVSLEYFILVNFSYMLFQ